MRADVGDLPFQVISSDQVRGVRQKAGLPPRAIPASQPTPTGPKGQRIPELNYPSHLLLHMSVTSSFFQKWRAQGLSDSQVSNCTIRSRQKMQSTKESTPHTLNTNTHPHIYHTHCHTAHHTHTTHTAYTPTTNTTHSYHTPHHTHFLLPQTHI